MRKYLKPLLLLFAVLVLVGGWQETNAQAPSKCNPNDPDYNPDDECIPIDGGLTILILAGVGYGIKKYGSNRRNQQTDTSPQN